MFVWLPMVLSEIYQTLRRLHHNLYPQMIVNAAQAIVCIPLLIPIMRTGLQLGLPINYSTEEFSK